MTKVSIWVFILVGWLITRLISSAKNKGKKDAQERRGLSTPTTRQPQRAPASRPGAAYRSPAGRDFSPPAAPCIVCENTGADHFQRDKARRIAQLDDWLKIGIIDRDEYRVLKDRYQRGI